MANQNIPSLEIGNLKIGGLLGGMGVGVSAKRLASAAANGGWGGTIASVGLGAVRGHFTALIKINQDRIQKSSGEERKKVYDEIYALANHLALIEEIEDARKLTKGVIGVNIMHALSDYPSLVQAALKVNADYIISGAGIPRDLPAYAREMGNTHTKLIPIVSSARLADMMCKSWKKYSHFPDAIVVEGPKAGGHLGYSYEQLADPKFVAQGLETIIREVIEAVKPYEQEARRKIPVIAAGGIYYGGDIARFLELGAAGVQMATRFVTTDECDACPEFKQGYLDSEKENIVIIKSPVGMPGRAILNDFLRRVESGQTVPISCPYHCLKTCVPEKSPYCIGNALTAALKGHFDKGYIFCGSNAWRCKEDGIISVKTLVEKLNQEYSEGKRSDLL